MDQIPKFDVTFPLENDDEIFTKAKELIKQVRPEWTDDLQLHLQFFTEGITNRILSIWHENTGRNDRVLIRIYGKSTELIISREAELVNMSFLGKFGCAPPLYGRLNNGLVYGFVSGSVLDTETVRDDPVRIAIAKEMAKVHSLKLSDAEKPVISEDPCLITKLNSWLHIMPDKFDDPAIQKRFESFPSKVELLSELIALEKLMESLGSPVVFCHNDLLLKNIIYNEADGGRAQFIDYEYAAFNFQAFDIADHFTEYAGVDNPDFNLYPEREYQLKWLRTYLEFHYEEQGKSRDSVTEQAVENLYVQVNICSAAAHFFWSIWAIIQAKHSTIDFDFLQYGIDRMAENKKSKEKYWGLLKNLKL